MQFVCGVRALHDYRAANQTAEGVARRFSVPREEAVEAVARLFAEHKQLERRVRALAELAATAEAQELLHTTPAIDGRYIISRIFAERDFDEVKLLAHRLVAHSGVIALLATHTDEMARLVFARSADLTVEMPTLLSAACDMLGGRGGGRPDLAQGGGPRVTVLEHAMAEAIAALTR